MPAPYLRVGQRGRLVEGGPVFEVEKVTTCSASVRRVHVVPKVVSFGERSFMARKGERLQISPTALLLPGEEE